MSLPIWTPAALSSEKRAISGRFWRLVEAQHQISTLKLVDTLDEQALLETLLEESKPALPPECIGLDYLLATPFRYGAVYPHGSRFRRAGRTLGVFYASERVETALAEMAFYRLLFYAESPATSLPANAAEYTAFAAAIATASAIDLTRAPLDADRIIWTDLQNYAPCQALADDAREAGCQAILYESVRDPRRGRNIALLTAAAFAAREPVERQTWRIRFSGIGVQALCDFPKVRIGFSIEDFARDPRIARG
ncbi:RES domain-containing protein [Rhizobium tibeticum]|uniref:RES domain protein n=1 Tax=Rhizobium tibeticum TaxID=501024 RepID=A0A1H8UBT2_9HYPH|nr:RES family NAD+ phosphorylase [Rhizobium tibeticum]SEI16979.1 RES domain protein [Rhizobium tibeticum]SEP00651.1 RES domain-containing protein [Rhizobium tibeticum]